MQNHSKAFTLVELIIVITILSILATIAFVSFQNYIKDARDSNRLATLKNIENGLNAFQITTGNYPEPDNKSTLFLSGTKVSYQGEIGKNVTTLIRLSQIPTDPQSTLPYYYATSDIKRGYKLLAYLENTQANLTAQTFAAQNTPVVRGIGPAILVDSENNIIKTDVDFFGAQSGTTYKVLVDNTTETTGSGIEIGGGFQMMALKGGDFSPPKSCLEGFIPVPGNPDFMQPGFCVMKYEASYDDISTPDSCNNQYPLSCTLNQDWNTVRYQSGKNISFSEGNYPIANIKQGESIDVCKKIGPGFHLITNNEWMTIARNIENNKGNWSNGVIGSGYVFNGVSNSDIGCFGVTNTIYTILTRARGTKTGAGGNALCDSKRQGFLNNNEIIWDFAGNIQEHVNKANTLDGGNYLEQSMSIGGSSTGNGRDNDGIYETFYMKKYASQNLYGTGQGMGNVWYASGILNNMLVRGGRASTGFNAGIYGISLAGGINVQQQMVGFRCAY